MKSFLISTFLFSLALSSASYSEPCPKTDAEWEALSHQQISRFLQTDSSSLLRTFAKHFEKCKVEDPKAAKCLQPWKGFVTAKSYSMTPGHTLNLPISDNDYYSKMDFPEMLELPKELKTQEFLSILRNDSDPDYKSEALKYIEKLGKKDWIAFHYNSQHLPTPDGSRALGRFFIFVPGVQFDRYIQFGLRASTSAKLPNSVSSVAVQKTDKSGKPLKTPEVRIKDFWRVYDNSGNIRVSTRLKEAGRLENCYDCHKSHILPITPEPASFDQSKFETLVKKVNARMGSYGSMAYPGLTPEAYGPGMGPADKVRSDAYLTACTGVADKSSLARLRDAMRCTDCHDGYTRGTLNYPSGKSNQLSFFKTSLLHSYVVKNQKMPPGEELSQTERNALASCLVKEYYDGVGSEAGIFPAWLQNQSCWDE